MADRFPALAPEEWKSYLEGGHPNAMMARRLRRFFAHIPSPPRCRHCLSPFAGPLKPILPLFGKEPAEKNPTYCKQCFGWLTRSRGGAEVELSMFFADVRGSTPLSARFGPSAFARLMSRFYATGVDILARSDALIERFMGDRVVGYYFPGFAGPEHARRAVDAGLELLRATGNVAGREPWIPVGIGIHTGVPTRKAGATASMNYCGSAMRSRRLREVYGLGRPHLVVVPTRPALSRPLRHSAATILLAAGVSERVVMEILGHSTVAMVKRYQHVLPGLTVATSERMHRAMGR